MSQSFPFLNISRKLGIPYRDILKIADYWFAQEGVEVNYCEGKTSNVSDFVLDAVIREKQRRAAVIHMSQINDGQLRHF